MICLCSQKFRALAAAISFILIPAAIWAGAPACPPVMRDPTPGMFATAKDLGAPDLAAVFAGLDFGAEIPREIYAKYDSRKIGEAIVDWVRAREVHTTPSVPSQRVDLLRDSQIVIQFRPLLASAIAEMGYLNQHQSGNSTGNLTGSRASAEDEFVGLKMAWHGENELSVRPKCALVIISAPVDLPSSYDVYPTYGEVGAVMKPEVKRRALWMVGDSLGLGYSRYTSSRNERELNNRRGTFFRDSFPNKLQGYLFEAAIFGAISADDIDHFQVAAESDAEDLKQFRKPIFLVKIGTDYSRPSRSYLKLIYRGEGEPKSLPSGEWARLKSES